MKLLLVLAIAACLAISGCALDKVTGSLVSQSPEAQNSSAVASSDEPLLCGVGHEIVNGEPTL